MRFLNFTYRQIYRTVAVLLTVFLLTGCPGLIPSEVSDDGSQPSHYYLDKINQSQGAAKIDYQILAARAFLREGNIPRSEQLLATLSGSLSPEQKTESLLVSAELQGRKRNYKSANSMLNAINIHQLSKNQQVRYYQVRIGAANKKDVLNTLRHYVQLEQVIDKNQSQNIIDGSWDILASLPLTTLNSLTINASEHTLQGWLDLALIYANHKDSVAVLQNEIKNWQQRYPDNPYAKSLPTKLAGVLNFETVQVKKIALLLPLEGQAKVFGEAIERGFRDGMKASNENHVELSIHDTSKESLPELIRTLETSTSPVVIVGPLLKPDVAKLISTKTNLTALTLNKPDVPTDLANACYFALSPEDEAEEAANYIFANNHKNPLLIVPKSDFGQRVAKAFDNQWASKTNKSVLVQYFTNARDLTESMNHRTGIRLTGSPVVAGQAVADGRVDAVYIVSNRDELTLIRSMIDMEVGNRITPSAIYASSRSHNSSAGPDFRLEMEHMRFSDIPLLAGANSQVFRHAMSEFKGDYSQVRLYAFGLDAWKLVNSFAEIRQLPNYEIKGYTGTLSSDKNCVINRKLSWLEYRQGSIVAAR